MLVSFLAAGVIGMGFYHIVMEDSVDEATVILKVEPEASDDGWEGWIEKGHIDGDRGYLFDAHANSGDGYARSRTGPLADRTSFVLVGDESDESVLFVVHGSKRTFKDSSVSVLVGGIPAPSASNRMEPSKYDAVVFATAEALADAGIDAEDAVDVSESSLPERADEFRDMATGEVVTDWENDLG